MKPSTLLIVIEIPGDCLGQRMLLRWKFRLKNAIFVVKRWPEQEEKILKIIINSK